MSAHRTSFQLALALLVTSQAAAQTPTYHDVVGRDFGDRITLHHEMVRYLNAVAESSPRVRVEVLGRSWEGREFVMAIVTSPENHARLEEIRLNSLRLDDPRATPVSEVQSIIATQPVVQWFGGSIHGFELSGGEAALKLLEHLSTGTDPATLDVLDNVVVLIDPMLNPDGRDAWAHKNHENVGRVPSPEPEDWANDITGWEGLKYRTGHYYFDNNRDWFAQTQPVTRARVAAWREWRPQVVTDMHEMGVDNEFFFYPGAEPVTPHVQGFAWTWIGRFAGAYAAAFDSAGFSYMTREAYDYFYPGYTDGYASHLGSVGMLYEQGNSRGLMIRRSDRTVRTLADGTRNQYTAAWAAVRYAATQRQALLREYYDGLASVIAEGENGTRRFLIDPGGDPTHRRSLVEMLRLGGVEVGQLTSSVTLANVSNREGIGVGRRPFIAGTYVVEMAQPRGRLVRALLDPETPIPESFLAEARERVDRGQSDEIYDVSAWSLPLLFDLAVFNTTDGRDLPVTAVSELTPVAANGDVANATYAYLLDGNNTASVAALSRLLQRGFVAGMTLRDTRIRGEDVPSGTVVVRVQPNSADVHAVVREVADHFGVMIRAMASGYGDEGQISLGSEDVVSVRKPSVAILAEEPVQGYSFGWAWYALDRQYEIPATPLRVRSVADTRLESFDVIVIPAASSSGLRRTLEDSGMERLRRWVRDGGTLVTIGGATDFAMDSSGLNLIELRSWYDTEDGEEAQRLGVPGAIVRGAIEPAYWLAAGVGDTELPLLIGSSRVYLPPEGPPSSDRRVVVRYAPSDSLALSGHLWPESIERLGGNVFLYEERVGRGRVIAFAEDPNFRGYWRGVDRLFLNAVVVGPSAP